MAAFDKLTGAVIWETKGFGDNATYCTSRLVEWNGRRQVIGGTEMHVFGVDPETGTMLWNDSQWTPDLTNKKWQNAMINSPVFYKVKLLVSLGDGPIEATAWGCDLTYDYVKINGDYRT